MNKVLIHLFVILASTATLILVATLQWSGLDVHPENGDKVYLMACASIVYFLYCATVNLNLILDNKERK